MAGPFARRRQHGQRAVGMVGQLVTDRAQDHSGQRAVATRAHHQQVGVLGNPQQRGARRSGLDPPGYLLPRLAQGCVNRFFQPRVHGAARVRGRHIAQGQRRHLPHRDGRQVRIERLGLVGRKSQRLDRRVRTIHSNNDLHSTPSVDSTHPGWRGFQRQARGQGPDRAVGPRPISASEPGRELPSALVGAPPPVPARYPGRPPLPTGL